jgi:hypothetical protein
MLIRHRQRLAAGGDDTDARRCSDDLGHKQGGSFEQMLAVVHHQQQLLVAQVGEQQIARRRRGLVPQVQRGQHGVAHKGRIPNVGKLDQPCAVPETARDVGRGLDGQPSLADAAWPDEADQTRRSELLLEFRELVAAADEAGRFRRQIARAAYWPGHGGQDCTRARESVPPSTRYLTGNSTDTRARSSRPC